MRTDFYHTKSIFYRNHDIIPRSQRTLGDRSFDFMAIQKGWFRRKECRFQTYILAIFQKSSFRYRTVGNQVRTHSRRRVSKSEYVSLKCQPNSLIKTNCYIEKGFKMFFCLRLREICAKFSNAIYIYIYIQEYSSEPYFSKSANKKLSQK